MNHKKEFVTAYTLFILLMATFIIIVSRYPIAYIWLTYEDLFGEWSQFYLFAIAMVLSGRLAIQRSQYAPFFALLSLACLYVCGEEISWGQRLFALETPQFFQQHNLQQETNLHNFITGPYNTALKRAIEIGLVIALVGFGAIYPQPFSNRLPLVKRLKQWIPPAPIYLWPFFCFGALLELRLLRFNEAELAEILISLGLALYCLYHWHLDRQHHSARRALRPMSSGMLMIVCAALCLATTTIAGLYTVPHHQQQMDHRITKGMKKFAERYGRYDQWQHSYQLYNQLLEKKPKSVFLLQQLAVSQQKLGYTKEAERTLHSAVQLDMRKFSKYPGSVSLNLSLSKTFTLFNNEERALFHQQKALDNSLRKTSLEPDNAHACYWLGRSYQYAGEHDKAIKQFERAHNLSPDVLRYQRALYKARQT